MPVHMGAELSVVPLAYLLMVFGCVFQSVSGSNVKTTEGMDKKEAVLISDRARGSF